MVGGIIFGIRDSRFGTPIVWGFGIRDVDYLWGRGLAIASPPINRGCRRSEGSRCSPRRFVLA